MLGGSKRYLDGVTRTLAVVQALAVGLCGVDGDSRACGLGRCRRRHRLRGTVARGEVGVLLNDLDCSTPAPGPAAVTLQNRATLQMNGHRVTFTPPAPETYGFGIECSERGRCLIPGPGELTGELIGVLAQQSKLTISDVV